MKRTTLACALIALVPAMGCEAVNEVPLRVLLPENPSDLEAADNLTLLLNPGGEFITQAADGTDFSVELTIPEDTLIQAELYLAQGSTLLAWGRTPYFLDASPAGASMFLGRPGQLSTFPMTLDGADPDVAAAYLPQRGVFVLESSGAGVLLSEYSLELGVAASLDDAPALEQGGLFTVPVGVARIAWGGESNFAARFDTNDPSWAELSTDLPGADELTTDAPFGTRGDLALFIYGTSAVHEVDLGRLEDATVTVESTPLATPHDGARPGGHLLALELEDATELLVFGSTDDRPVFWSDAGGAFGPDGPWTGGRCVQTDPGVNATLVLCTGGLRGEAPTADLVVLERGSDGSWTVDERPDALPAALSDPLWYSDETALYAQGEGQLLRIAREGWEPDNAVSSAQRFAEGHSVQLPTGATFQVGGYGQEGQPLSRWQVFMPALQP